MTTRITSMEQIDKEHHEVFTSEAARVIKELRLLADRLESKDLLLKVAAMEITYKHRFEGSFSEIEFHLHISTTKTPSKPSKLPS